LIIPRKTAPKRTRLLVGDLLKLPGFFSLSPVYFLSPISSLNIIFLFKESYDCERAFRHGALRSVHFSQSVRSNLSLNILLPYPNIYEFARSRTLDGFALVRFDSECFIRKLVAGYVVIEGPASDSKSKSKPAAAQKRKQPASDEDEDEEGDDDDDDAPPAKKARVAPKTAPNPKVAAKVMKQSQAKEKEEEEAKEDEDKDDMEEENIIENSEDEPDASNDIPKIPVVTGTVFFLCLRFF
jgi:hypothetical protein